MRLGAGYAGAGGRLTNAARDARWRSDVPRAIDELLARLRYRCAGCSQVKPIPPCSWIISWPASTAVSEQAAFASATAIGVSGSRSARHTAAYRDAARACVT